MSDNFKESLSQASESLGGRPLAREFDIVSTAYAQPSRKFHGNSHSEDMADLGDKDKQRFITEISTPEQAEKLLNIGKLAGFYHDAVYTQVDKGVTLEIEEVLNKYGKFENGAFQTKELADISQNQDIYKMTLDIFGVTAGDNIPKPPPALQNEFLSGLLMADHMKELGIADKEIAQALVVVAGTIPFRKDQYFVDLAERLQNSGVPITQEEVNNTLKLAVTVANQDVNGFVGGGKENAEERLKFFLANTWKLIPEMKLEHRGNDYKPEQYRKTMQGEHFFSSVLLDGPLQVFHQYNNYPNESEITELRGVEKEVRANADLYLKAKVVSVALVESLAEKAGAADLTLPEIARGSENNLPKLDLVQDAHPALKILSGGREGDSAFDYDKSPIAAYLLSNIGEEKINQMFAEVNSKLNSKDSPPDYRNFLKASVEIAGDEVFSQVADSLRNAAKDNGRDELSNGFAMAKRVAVLSAKSTGFDIQSLSSQYPDDKNHLPNRSNLPQHKRSFER